MGPSATLAATREGAALPGKGAIHVFSRRRVFGFGDDVSSSPG